MRTGTNSESLYIKDRSAWDLSEFLSSGGQIEHVPYGFSNEVKQEFNKSNAQSHMKQIMGAAIAEARAKKELKPKRTKTEAEIEAKRQSDKERKRIKDAQSQAVRRKAKADLSAEQISIFKEFHSKASHGDIALLARLTGVSATTLKSTMYGETVMKKDRWDGVKKHLLSFDYSINESAIKGRLKKEINQLDQKAYRKAYRAEWQEVQRAKLKQITEKYCGVVAL
ncbi:hypothetical protein [Acinetobacter guillouiae]|uniref:hypothetical protein n=1 Tax=Acinetobacter guillouiae TaxID=106649 RepID=UPI0028EC5F05|nr:hypothetical protein [Acinetobacter guillouiae]